jgi:hypothetical protein
MVKGFKKLMPNPLAMYSKSWPPFMSISRSWAVGTFLKKKTKPNTTMSRPEIRENHNLNWGWVRKELNPKKIRASSTRSLNKIPKAKPNALRSPFSIPTFMRYINDGPALKVSTLPMSNPFKSKPYEY